MKHFLLAVLVVGCAGCMEEHGDYEPLAHAKVDITFVECPQSDGNFMPISRECYYWMISSVAEQ